MKESTNKRDHAKTLLNLAILFNNRSYTIDLDYDRTNDKLCDMSNFEMRFTKDGNVIEVIIPASILQGYDLGRKQRLIRSCVELACEKAKE